MPRTNYLLTPEQRAEKKKFDALRRMSNIFHELSTMSELNISEIAALWGCDRSTVRRKIRKGTVTMTEMCMLMGHCGIEMEGFRRV